MPCYSASNLRFVGAGQQQLQYAAKDRARTSVGIRNTSDPNLHSTSRKQCEAILQARGYGPLELNKVRGIKSAKVPKTGSRSHQAMLPQKEFERLKSAAKVVTVEERLDALMKQEQESKRLEEEAEKTREHFKKMDDARKRAAEANVEKEDLFGAGEKLKVLERSFLAKTEQEEEVKRVNRIILNAKCHAIRDAQIQEKTELERQLRSQEIQLEKAVIDIAVKALNEEDLKVEKKKEANLKYAKDIRQQLNEREALRFLEAERIEQEAKMLRKANEAHKRDEERQARLEQERRTKFRQELNKIAEMSSMFKKMLCEQERETEMRVATYMRQKEQRERQLKVEKKIAQEDFERKQARIFMLSQKMLESKSNREESMYLREKEKIEREYRRKEKETAIRKRQIEQELIAARAKQLQETKHWQALQIAIAEKDFNELIERMKQEEAKQRIKDEEVNQRRKCYRSDIIRQMSDKELERRRLLELERNQAMAWRESERQRDSNIRAVINAKLGAMRDACLPEKYIKDVEKQMQKIELTRNVMQKPQ